jgi:hypothetical protein
MRTKLFIGKAVDVTKLKKMDTCEYLEAGEYDDQYAVADIELQDFDLNGPVDRSGRNAYSLHIYLDGARIVKILRIGLCNMCVGGSEDEMRHFSSRLEAEAQSVIESLLTV